jgi:2-polyprenyl-3-methyl-5-hydroxy-6-metoxy-1,4-benzoquinol methylase
LGFFDFLSGMELYENDEGSVARMNTRHKHLIQLFGEEIKDAKVFDIASHDGRWAYAFAGAGAKQVVGVEARQHLIDLFKKYPDAKLRNKVELRCNDLFKELEAEVEKGETYDVVSVFGIFYHIMDHMRLLKLVRALKPKLIIVDSEFMVRPGAIIRMVREKTDKRLNAAPQIEGQEVAAVGYPSYKAMDMMADVLGYDIEWVDWDLHPAGDRVGVHDYYRDTGKRRGTCALWPKK